MCWPVGKSSVTRGEILRGNCGVAIVFQGPYWEGLSPVGDAFGFEMLFGRPKREGSGLVRLEWDLISRG